LMTGVLSFFMTGVLSFCFLMTGVLSFFLMTGVLFPCSHVLHMDALE